MPKTRRILRAAFRAALLATGALTALAITAAPAARAQSGPGGDIELDAFHPAIDSRGFITINASRVLGHKELSFGLVSNWGRNLLRLESGDVTYRVQHIFTPTLVGAFGLGFRPLALELGLSVPFSIMSGDRDPDTLGAPDDPNDDERHSFTGQGVGDIGVHGKLRLLGERRGLGVAVIGSLYLPTASAESAWIGAGALRWRALAVVDKELGPVTVAVNAGISLRSGGTSLFRDDQMLGPDGQPQPVTDQTVEVGSTIPLGLGVAYALAPGRFDLVGEVFAEMPLAGQSYFPVEAIGGVKLYLAKNSFFTIGGGAGLLSSRAGNPDLRAFIGIVFEPRIGDRDGDGLKDDIDECPAEPEDFDDFADSDGCPDVDNDGDGILDVDDQCPNEPEDRDGDADEDGCPENSSSDRDGDGILDEEDQCPDDPEDFDGFEDQDGCPDTDNDGDRILDVDDLCPDEAEDHDDWEDRDGCPELDNDRDRIPDTDDRCPNKPEMYNDYKDEDGCPDRGVVVVSDTTIVPLDKIYFEYDSAVIKEESHPILETIARTINLNPDIERIEIQGHTDERGSDDYNERLSQSRAESVRAFLISRQVAESRLDARGYGESRPLDRHHNEAAWSTNRRVEFIIIKRSSD